MRRRAAWRCALRSTLVQPTKMRSVGWERAAIVACHSRASPLAWLLIVVVHIVSCQGPTGECVSWQACAEWTPFYAPAARSVKRQDVGLAARESIQARSVFTDVEYLRSQEGMQAAVGRHGVR